MNLVTSLKRRVKAVLNAGHALILGISASSRLTTGMYYLVTGHFAREHYATISGRIAYQKSLKDPKSSSALLRRNVHRLEKGLLMRPRRVPFGLNYIEETVSAYCRASKAGVERTELAWARDVLNEYMDASPSHPKIEPLRALVAEANDEVAKNSNCRRMIPYIRDPNDAPAVTYDDLLALAKYRRSVRWFLARPVPRDMIDRAITVAGYSPTACNRQPYEFRIMDDPALVQQAINLPMGTGGFSHQVPAVAIIVGKQRNYFKERDRHLIYTDASLAIMSFVYALEVQGLASCCINWPDVEEREQKMEKFLRLEQDERPIMLVAIGFPDPDGMVAYSSKKPLSTLRTYNFESK
ncbi:nitroreductase family protein [Stenotrophomonas maltophilia]|uniref:nitroreductase family protein n=1 Tax=Stenotrophomonas maltophilia TaxID=40324 RepID=UPI002ACCE8A4|nr:nitroreductase family protein [Stenotrophomonas maltophilia]MDZ5841076.1 nitroreductase family protein [Stenotrophomonas maltophilia]